ncbi:MAG TPA: hypothetical protein VGH84_13050 [Steroidobacteraceae bacterium]
MATTRMTHESVYVYALQRGSILAAIIARLPELLAAFGLPH